jgi:hypothetical protein
MKFIAHIASILLFGLILGMAGCNINRPCEEPTEFPVVTGYYDSTGADTTLSDLTIYGMGMEDSLLYDRDTLQSVSLPLNPFTDTTRFIMTFGVHTDTLNFFYQRNLRMINPECGFAIFFEIKSFNHTYHFIDSVSLLDQNLDAQTQEHLQIFVH